MNINASFSTNWAGNKFVFVVRMSEMLVWLMLYLYILFIRCGWITGAFELKTEKKVIYRRVFACEFCCLNWIGQRWVVNRLGRQQFYMAFTFTLLLFIETISTRDLYISVYHKFNENCLLFIFFVFTTTQMCKCICDTFTSI